MPSIETIRAGISKLPEGPPLVAVLAGGTTGIGSYIAQALAATFAKHGDKLRVYVVGRNAARAENVIAECSKKSPASEWRFVQGDLALVNQVDRCCEEIIRQETEAPFCGGPVRIDLLYMTYSYPILKERSTTSEGLDSFISTVYYTRMRFITQLLSVLLASPLPAHVVSVYAGTMEDGTKPGEFPVGTPPDSIYGVNSVRKHSIFMKTFLFEELAEKYAGKLSLIDIFPGLVDGPGFLSPDMPLWFRIIWRILKPIAQFAMTSPEICGQVMLYLATDRFPAKGTTNTGDVARASDGEVGGGAYSVGQRADEQKGIMYEKVRLPDTRKRIWDHTMETLEKAKAKAL